MADVVFPDPPFGLAKVITNMKPSVRVFAHIVNSNIIFNYNTNSNVNYNYKVIVCVLIPSDLYHVPSAAVRRRACALPVLCGRG